MKVWEVNYWASGPSVGDRTLRYRRFKWRWTARVYRWWLIYCPVYGMQVFAPVQEVRRITKLGKR